jgi:hypothetical protein
VGPSRISTPGSEHSTATRSAGGQHGVQRHWIYLSPEADYVVIGLEFASLEQANAFKNDLDATLGEVWAQMGVDGSAARALEEVEAVAY